MQNLSNINDLRSAGLILSIEPATDSYKFQSENLELCLLNKQEKLFAADFTGIYFDLKTGSTTTSEFSLCEMKAGKVSLVDFSVVNDKEVLVGPENLPTRVTPG